VSIQSDIIFTTSQSLIEKMQCKPVVGSEVQHVEYNNEGQVRILVTQHHGGDKRLKLVWENLERPQTGLNNY
jgi:hypothetical protein